MRPVRNTGRKYVHIAAGCIQNARGEVLICQRPAHKIYPGEWEFPGGKVEPGESAEQALHRELREELGIRISQCRPLIRLRHVYPELAVDLDTWLVSAYDGVVRSNEHPDQAWVQADELPRWKLLAADRPIVSALRLPGHYAFTPPDKDFSWLCRHLERLPTGTLLRLRLPESADAQYESLARELAPLCRTKKLPLLLDRNPAMTGRLGAAGWHATAVRLRSLKRRPVPESIWFAASCHNAEELRLARDLGADFAVIGPVLATVTHPQQAPLGWPAWSELALGAGMPVYAIGGLKRENLVEAQTQGAQGVAGIRTFWDATGA